MITFYSLVRGDIITTAHNNSTPETLKNCALFIKCIANRWCSTQELDLAMPMYNLIERNSNCSDTTGILWFYSKDKATNFDVNIADKNNFKSFNYKAKLFENTAVDGDNSMLKKCSNHCTIKISK